MTKGADVSRDEDANAVGDEGNCTSHRRQKTIQIILEILIQLCDMLQTQFRTASNRRGFESTGQPSSGDMKVNDPVRLTKNNLGDSSLVR